MNIASLPVEYDKSRLHTVCLDCCFAIWNGDVQTGCKFDLLDLFRKKTNVYEAENEEGKQFNLIDNTLCVRRRTESWLETYKDTYLEQLHYESRIDYVAIILVDYNSTKIDINDSVEFLLDQEPQPGEIVICNYFSKIVPTALYDLMKHIAASTSMLKYRIDNISDSSFKVGDAIDFSISKSLYNYLLITKAGYYLDSKFVKSVQQSIYRNFNIVGLLMANEENYLIDRRLYGLEKYNLIEDIYKKYPEFSVKWHG